MNKNRNIVDGSEGAKALNFTQMKLGRHSNVVDM